VADELSFALELWDTSDQYVETVLARVANALIARAAFEKACELYPGRVVMLRQGIRVVEHSFRR
jgi:hypothetical protein